MTTPSFSQEIDRNKQAEFVSDASTTLENPAGSRLSIRRQGCFVTEALLVSDNSDTPVNILYSPANITINKLSASHIMSPVGPSEGIGGQHGFPRWAKYHEFAQPDGPDGEKQVVFQAERSDTGLGISKYFVLGESTLETETGIINSEDIDVQTSIGEHLYFALEDENTSGLTINGSSIDELLGEGAEQKIMDGDAVYWPEFNGQAVVHFPAGHTIEITASTDTLDPVGMLLWHRKDTPSLCLEPTVGFNSPEDNTGLEIYPYESITLATKIELLSSERLADIALDLHLKDLAIPYLEKLNVLVDNLDYQAASKLRKEYDKILGIRPTNNFYMYFLEGGGIGGTYDVNNKLIDKYYPKAIAYLRQFIKDEPELITKANKTAQASVEAQEAIKRYVMDFSPVIPGSDRDKKTIAQAVASWKDQLVMTAIVEKLLEYPGATIEIIEDLFR